MNFWRLLPKFSTPVDAVAGLDVKWMIYAGSGNRLNTVMPDLKIVQGNRNIYDESAVLEMGEFLTSRGQREVLLDYEPNSHGDKAGYSRRNRLIGRQIIATLRECGVLADLYDIPPIADDWTASTNSNKVILPSMYTFGADAQEWHDAYLKVIAKLRKKYHGFLIGPVISPFFGGGPFQPAVPDDYWRVQLDLVETYCDFGHVFAARAQGNDTPWSPFERTDTWWQTLRSRIHH